MCGILGIILTANSHTQKILGSNILESLFYASQSRGSEATGAAFTLGKDRKTKIFKCPQKASAVMRLREWKKLMNSVNLAISTNQQVSVIGHTRIATNGSLMKNDNNQPIIGNFSVCAHNGIILNDISLWKQHSELRRKLRVDSEIVIALYEMYRNKNFKSSDALIRVFSEIEGETNVVIQDRTEDTCVLATNTGSLYYMLNKYICVFASERYILRSVIQSDIPKCIQTPLCHLKANSGLIVSTRSATGIKFPITKDKIVVSNKYDSTVNMNSYSYFENISHKDSHQLHHPFNNSLLNLRKHIPNFKGISRIKRCSRCIMPETMPMIEFDRNGICNFCRTYIKQEPKGIKALHEKIDLYKSRNSEYDCIVPLSGGRDSSYGLFYIKNILKLNPIAYTYDWGMISEVGRRNQSRMCAKLGVEHIWVSADIAKKRGNIKKNIEAWLQKPDLGMITLLMAGDKQAEYYVEKLRKQTGIDLVIYSRGNQIEDERFKFGYFGIFDGTPKGVIHDLSSAGKFRMLTYYAQQFFTNPAYLNTSLVDSLLAYTSSYIMKHDFIYLWHYIRWDERKLLQKIIGKYGWEHPTDTVATWRIDDGTPAFYNYIYYTVQGFTENDGLRSNQIREGVITREAALHLVAKENKPRYKSLKWYFDTVGIDGDRALTIIDRIPKLY